MQIQHIALFARDNERVAEFYKEVFGLVEVHRTYHRGEGECGIHLSDGHIGVAVLLPHPGPKGFEGIAHFGFKIADEQERSLIEEKAEKYGGKKGEFRPKEDRFRETLVYDPVGTKVDISVGGWRVEPGGPPYNQS